MLSLAEKPNDVIIIFGGGEQRGGSNQLSVFMKGEQHVAMSNTVGCYSWLQGSPTLQEVSVSPGIIHVVKQLCKY